MHINLIGGGLAGSLMAVYLGRQGHQTDVFERRPDMRAQRVDRGRSINLALSARGLKSLEETGLKEAILQLAIPMYGRVIHSPEGKLSFQPYSSDGKECIYSVSRADLNMQLMDAAEQYEGVRFHFRQACEDLVFPGAEVKMRNLETQEVFTAPGEISLATDGAFSAARYDLQKTPRFNFSQDYLEYGYKELTIPAGSGGAFQMEKHALHIWPRETFMLIALPNPDGSFTCTLFLAYEGAKSFAGLSDEAAVSAFFRTEFPDAEALIPNLTAEFFENPTGSLVTMRCFPWVFGDKLALMGDAAHAIVPFFGQGMNAAFEDCSAMNDCLKQYPGDLRSAFDAYQRQRKPHADAIAQMALENFIEMRDKVGDADFLFRKQVERILGRNFPQFRSRYELVSFTTLPYAEALRRGEINDRILDTLTRSLKNPEEVDLELAKALIEKELG
ncbi:MAG: FAD-dependent monooxygenase [Bacteroidetes bacterium]|nr:MAG: FAD-dependent monooxygenase [Bacteroidota bacterium]